MSSEGLSFLALFVICSFNASVLLILSLLLSQRKSYNRELMAPLLHLVVLVKMTESKQFVMQQEILVLQIYQEVSFLTEQLLRIFFIYSTCHAN